MRKHRVKNKIKKTKIMNRFEYQKGQKFGRSSFLNETVTPSHIKDQSDRYAVFKCECGNEYIASIKAVKHKGSGCYHLVHSRLKRGHSIEYIINDLKSK